MCTVPGTCTWVTVYIAAGFEISTTRRFPTPLVVPAEGLDNVQLGAQPEGTVQGNIMVAGDDKVALKGLRVMLAGHCDQIGLIVQHIDDEGFLFIQPIGGWDPEVLIGQRMSVWTESGPILGVIARLSPP